MYKSKLKRFVGKYPTLLLKANEREKTIVGVNKVINFLQKVRLQKTLLIGIGGGIIQDVTTLLHIFYRGIEWHYYPTTLLSMSDSCIGANVELT